MPGSSLIGNLAVSLNMETAAFQRSATLAEKRAETMRGKFGGLAKSIGGMGLALGAGFVAGGITSAVSGAFELGSALSEAAEKMGVTVEGLQRLRVAARETGVSNEQLDAAMVKLNKSLGGLQLGSAAATKAFAQIGLSAADLAGKKPDEALRIIADALNKIPDPQARIAIGSELMGKNFAQLIPMISGGSAALDKYAEQSKKSGEVSDENARKLDELADRWEGFKVSVGVASANIIAATGSLYDKVNGWLIAMGDGARSFDAATAQMARNAVQWVNNMVTGIGSAITGRLSSIWEGAKEKIETVRQAFFNLADKVQFRSYIPDMVDGIASTMARLQEVLVDPTLNATQKAGAAFQELGSLVGSVFGQKAGGILSAVGQLASALGPLLGGGTIKMPTTVGGSSGAYPLPKFANGGAGVFGGRAGNDNNLLSLNGSPIARVSRGEHFSVSPNGGAASRVQIIPSPYFDVVVDHRASNVAAPMASRAAMVGAASGQQATMQRQRRSIP
ncbi:MAG: hypothetical protein V4696_01470 [Pseudomonadota bacterium]